jgi:hypothetical protein
MDDGMMFDYLLQMGAMRPEQDELKRKQALVDALRGNALEPMQGQMIGKHYVGGGLGGALSKLGQAYFAKQGQQGVDTGLAGMNDRQRQLLEEMRKRRLAGMAPAAPATPTYSAPPEDLGPVATSYPIN